MASLEALDQWLATQLAQIPSSYQWLFIQTLATTASRRSWLESLPIDRNALIIDLGSGPGIMAQEISLIKHCRVLGIDHDAQLLALAQVLNRVMEGHNRVDFHEADLLAREGHRNGDGVVSRFVTQYLPDLKAFFSQARTHLKSGGFVAVEDVDDGYLIEYPKPPDVWQRMIETFQTYQQGPRGDRHVGRKLAEAGVQAGLNLISTTLAPGVHAGWMTSTDLSVQFDIARIEQAIPDMRIAGLISDDAWHIAKSAYEDSFPHFTYVSSATVRLLFRVP